MKLPPPKKNLVNIQMPVRTGKSVNILALDPATHCGWAHSNGLSGTWDLSVKKDESSGMRLMRLRQKLDETDACAGVSIVMFEAARGGMPGRLGALVVSSEIQGVIKLWCEENHKPYKGVSPSEVKKHATGKGNANKKLMMLAATDKWNKEMVDDNEADALWILDFAQKTFI
jgi:Holliday junction resolvasome RuvABC endonuclease subunit